MLQEIELLARRAAVNLPAHVEAAETVASVDEPTAPDPLAALTPRERLVLDRLADGESNREIARALFISEKTASVHVSHILAKLGVSSRVQAGMFGQRVATAAPIPPERSDMTEMLLRRAETDEPLLPAFADIVAGLQPTRVAVSLPASNGCTTQPTAPVSQRRMLPGRPAIPCSTPPTGWPRSATSTTTSPRTS